ncbi:NAD kinase [Lactobacillus sp. DCY120]|uniref:NAD kinase n=1 Tax=Bombilactobacillus apium TaxID=2675299 RepID=A0A850R8E3_9LACO|nr:NAD kinase [Bombilactobacillus apium]NVY96805.1 NAD kinase [Bombilactobacillus apium]
MRVWIQSNSKSTSLAIQRQLRFKLLQQHIKISEEYPDLVITVGGDGTFLSAFHRFSNQLDHLLFIGIHTGHLGFYTDWQDNELDDLVRLIVQNQKKIIRFPLLDVKVSYTNGHQSHFLSLNESIIKRVSQTMRADVLIDGHKFERFRGDGISMSTPTGSTAYSKSIGGAIVDPSLEVMQFNEVAPINNRVYRTVNSSLILPQKQILTILPDRQTDYIVTVDNLSYDHCSIQKIEYQIAREKIQIAEYRPKQFWLRVKNAFLVN